MNSVNGEGVRPHVASIVFGAEFMNGARDTDSGRQMEGAGGDDPLCRVIYNYRKAFDDYNANAPSEDIAAHAYAEITYRPRRRIIMDWDKPAGTQAAALAALRLARDAGRCDDHSVVAPMVDAALAYFEKQQ